MREMLAYDSRDGRYHGTDSGGASVTIDGDDYAEALAIRMGWYSDESSVDLDARYHAADAELADPDGWCASMSGWIPAGE